MILLRETLIFHPFKVKVDSEFFTLPKKKITCEAKFCLLFSGLAEAGLITSKLSNRDLLNDVEGTFLFSPERYVYVAGNSSSLSIRNSAFVYHIDSNI